jgi:hypothetical protein
LVALGAGRIGQNDAGGVDGDGAGRVGIGREDTEAFVGTAVIGELTQPDPGLTANRA